MMIATLLAGLLAASEGGGTPLLLLLGPAGAGGVYFALYRYYRNTDKSHSFERETRIEAKPVTGTDRKIDDIKGTTKTEISGDNKSKHRQRVQRIN